MKESVIEIGDGFVWNYEGDVSTMEKLKILDSGILFLGRNETTSRPYTILKENITDGKIYKCIDCSKVYADRSNVWTHYRSAHLNVRKKRMTLCPYCDKSIPTWKKLLHFDEAHGIEAPTCGVCGKKFRLPSVLLAHQKNAHMKERDFACDVCDLKFFSNSLLKKHSRKHSGDRRFVCDVCSKGFVWKNNLIAHMLIHTGFKPKVCKFCNETFAQTASLSYHMVKRHPEMIWLIIIVYTHIHKEFADDSYTVHCPSTIAHTKLGRKGGREGISNYIINTLYIQYTLHNEILLMWEFPAPHPVVFIWRSRSFIAIVIIGRKWTIK